MLNKIIAVLLILIACVTPFGGWALCYSLEEIESSVFPIYASCCIIFVASAMGSLIITLNENDKTS